MFNASELSQLSGAGKTLREEIIEILSAAKEPMSCHDIMQISKLSPDGETMTREVYSMKQAGLVEQAGEVTRPGLPRPAWLYRLTQSDGEASQNSLHSDVQEEQQVKTEQSTKALQEISRVSSQDIRDLVILRPGIKREDVYKKLVFADGSNKKKVGNLISALISSNKLVQTEEGSVKRLHVGPTLNKAIAGKKPGTQKDKTWTRVKVPAGKLLMGEEAKPFQKVVFNSDNDGHIANDEKPTTEAQPTSKVAVNPGLQTLQNHLSSIAAALPQGTILSIGRGVDDRIEFTLDTYRGATFNMGENINGVVLGINALAVLQPFAENL